MKPTFILVHGAYAEGSSRNGFEGTLQIVLEAADADALVEG